MITSSYTPCLVSPDPTLTPDNLTRVLEIMEDGAWVFFANYINLPDTEWTKIRSRYASDRDHKLALPHVFISAHPTPSWERVAHALYQMRDDSCHRALKYLQQHYPTGIYSVHALVCSTGDSAHVCECKLYVQCTLYTEIASNTHVHVHVQCK